jgi:hypothetical protein
MLTDPTRPPTSSSRPTATRWPSPSAPATAPTSSPEAHRRHPRHRPHQGNPRPHPQHPPGDARLVLGAAGAARDHPRVRRRHEGNLRRAGRGNRQGHQARRAQGQHRHRHPPGHDRRDPQATWSRTRTSSTRASTSSRPAKPPSWSARPASKPSAPPATPARSSRSASTRWPDVNFETEPELTCTNTGVSVVYTSIYAKYSGTDATESEPGEAEEDFL